MEPTIAILIWTVILVLVAPLILACVFISGTPDLFQISWKKPDILRLIQALFPSAEMKIELEIEKHHSKLQRKLIECRYRMARSAGSEKRLRARVCFLKYTIAQSELKFLTPQMAAEDKSVEKLRANLTEFEQKLKDQESQTETFREAASQIEDELQKAYSSKQIQMAKCKGERAMMAAEKILSKTKTDDYYRICMHKWEETIAKRETEAARGPFESKGKAKLSDDLWLVRVENFSRYCALKATSFKASLSDVVRAIDPSVVRAFRRLELQFDLAQQSAETAMNAESDLEDALSVQGRNLEEMMMRLKGGTHHRRGYAEERIPSLEQSTGALAEGLRSLRIKNLSIQQTLFCVEAIIKRLFILKMLIFASPPSKTDIPSRFIEFSNSLCDYLQSYQTNTSTNVPDNLVERLHSLEQSALMAYIRFAKSNEQQLSAKTVERLRGDIATISIALDLEREHANFEVERWTNIASLAEEENRQLLLAVARNRIERSCEILRMTEQTLDVLNVTISLTEVRVQKTKAS